MIAAVNVVNVDNDITEDILVAASSTAADKKHLQSPSGDHWFLNEPALQGRRKA